MLLLNDTELETFSFGEEDEDKYYILVNLKQNPDGINVQSLANADPRSFDQVLTQMGSLLMLTRIEINELIERGLVDANNLHESLFNLAKKEGIIS